MTDEATRPRRYVLQIPFTDDEQVERLKRMAAADHLKFATWARRVLLREIEKRREKK